MNYVSITFFMTEPTGEAITGPDGEKKKKVAILAPAPKVIVGDAAGREKYLKRRGDASPSR